MQFYKMENNVDKMPEPQTLNYNIYYVVTDRFINDFLTCTNEMAYVDVMKIMSIVNRHQNIVSSGQLNELIRLLGTFPYKYINRLMVNVSNKEIFATYFIQQPTDFKPGF